MSFEDRLHYFTKMLPSDLALYLRDQKHTEMESIYESARQWASRRVNRSSNVPSSSGSVNKSKSRGKSIFQSQRSSHTDPEKINISRTDICSDNDLDALDAIELQKVNCYNCGRLSHFSKDCKKPKKFKPKPNFKAKAKAFCSEITCVAISPRRGLFLDSNKISADFMLHRKTSIAVFRS
jgi:Zinc knuckle